jgi:nicotinamide phosphoribosyltransferase
MSHINPSNTILRELERILSGVDSEREAELAILRHFSSRCGITLPRIGGHSDRNSTFSFSDNIILMSDSYKVSHFVQYPPGTETIHSYFESRGGKFPEVLFFGLQYILKRYFCGKVVTSAKIQEAEEYFKLHFGTSHNFNKAGWQYILEKYDGHLPISIKAVAEGSVVPTHNVLLTCENTDPKCYWLTNFLETLLVQVWYPCTVATNSRAQRLLIEKWLRDTGCEDIEASAEFKLHDFGFRGVSSVESSAIGGLAHLVNFKGTDTMSAFVCGRQYYGCEMAGFSIPASEHSTITSWGRDGELEAFRNMLEKYPTGIVACVSDSWDVFNATKNYWGHELRDLIMQRHDGRLVIRPDSGDPPTVVVKCLELLGGAGGGFEEFVTKTKTGHRLLPSQVRLIQGDAVCYEMIDKIYAAMVEAGWAADNVGFGSGGALLQQMNRDTLKFAMKCSAVVINGKEMDVYKDPITDPGKKSKKGRLALVRTAEGYVTLKEDELDAMPLGTKNELVEVFRNGKLLVDYSFDEIRQRSRSCRQL